MATIGPKNADIIKELTNKPPIKPHRDKDPDAPPKEKVAEMKAIFETKKTVSAEATKPITGKVMKETPAASGEGAKHAADFARDKFKLGQNLLTQETGDQKLLRQSLPPRLKNDTGGDETHKRFSEGSSPASDSAPIKAKEQTSPTQKSVRMRQKDQGEGRPCRTAPAEALIGREDLGGKIPSPAKLQTIPPTGPDVKPSSPPSVSDAGSKETQEIRPEPRTARSILKQGIGGIRSALHGVARQFTRLGDKVVMSTFMRKLGEKSDVKGLKEALNNPDLPKENRKLAMLIMRTASPNSETVELLKDVLHLDSKASFEKIACVLVGDEKTPLKDTPFGAFAYGSLTAADNLIAQFQPPPPYEAPPRYSTVVEAKPKEESTEVTQQMKQLLVTGEEQATEAAETLQTTSLPPSIDPKKAIMQPLMDQLKNQLHILFPAISSSDTKIEEKHFELAQTVADNAEGLLQVAQRLSEASQGEAETEF